MRVILIIGFVALLAGSIRAESDADDSEGYEEVHNIEVDEFMTVEDACSPQPCGRSYEPFCVSIDGVDYQAQSTCEFDNHVRCFLAKRRDAGVMSVPEIEFVQDGECD